MKRIAAVLTMIAIFAALALSGCMPMGGGDIEAGGTPQDSTAGLMSFLPLILIIVVFYFILIRPQNKKNKQVSQMRESLKRGDYVTTIGGFKGRIVRIKDDSIIIEAGSDKVKLEIMKWGISKVDEAAPERKSSKKDRDEEPEEEQEKPKRKPKKLEPAQKKEEPSEEEFDDEDDEDDDEE